MSVIILVPNQAMNDLMRAIETKLAQEKARRLALKTFAEKAKQNVGAGKITDCQALVQIVESAASLVGGLKNQAAAMIDDLQLVLIGKGLLIGRNEGEFVVKNFHAKGFKKEFVDKYNQVQHAMAGIVIGYKFRHLEGLVLKLESEPQDIKLYNATFPLGEDLNKDNYMTLHKRIKNRLSE
jgi:GMP synthase PP-ATPase subunit